MKKLILQILKEETQQITEKFKVSPDEYVKLFKNDNFELVVPLTFEASKKYGANAKWCTTTRCDDTMFNKHNEMGSLAYLIIKNPEIAQRLGNTKYGLFINKPDDNYLGGKYAAPSGIMMYGDNNSILSQSQVENEFDKLDLLSDYYKMIRSFTEYSESKFSKESIQESRKDYHEDKITQVVNSLLKKYIPDNSTFETSFMTPYEDDNGGLDVYIEYSFDEKDTYFWKTDVEEDDDDDEPQRYEGTIHLLVNRLMIGNEDDDTWESVNYHDVPDWIWSEDFEDSIRKKIQPLLKSFNLDVDFDYKFIKEDK
jgi:hypothetical protein